MKVGIIGAGNMGSAFARRLGAAGHEVSIASRDEEDARNVASTVGGAVRARAEQGARQPARSEGATEAHVQ